MNATEEFNLAADPFLLGVSSQEHMCLDYALSEGWFFPWQENALASYILRRRVLYPDVGGWTYCGIFYVNADSIVTLPSFGHQANMAYQYSAAVAYGNAQASAFCEPVRVDFDAGRALISPAMPMFPRNLRVKPIAGGKFLVAWDYDPYGHGAWPADFRVFSGATAGSIDYGTPLTDSVTGLNYVPVYGAQRRFEFTTAAFANGTTKVFGVRARNASGVAEKNTRTSAAAIAMANVAATISSISQAVQGRQRP